VVEVEPGELGADDRVVHLLRDGPAAGSIAASALRKVSRPRCCAAIAAAP
jgi:hypothetical protein